ncbi:hypothetical protein CAPTEDRAFT_19831 [Capitella teleta]|uniref:L-type lectin-like domain-containing protein n=1 Tax=Capitella teleta TaxID=283909 RepID=R7VG57_CAPTE|nr:hypothetical protein CAPTEDRAFT_19831 [Capitella teleta]|eukprot:ELU17604.1 hypothetical protein CAPTEDRAFT_19831 [Capitella teleta]
MRVEDWFVVVFLSVISLAQKIGGLTNLDAHRRFEYKLSFKGPHLIQRDGSIPFWQHSGSAIASDESIRITPSLRSKKGQVWSQERNTAENWEIEVAFRVQGRGRIGADGLAIWYTANQGKEGPVFGSNDLWDGIGIFFDSFDNDNRHNNPYILAIVNKGDKVYDHKTDGIQQQIGGCMRDFRNKPFPVHVKVEYFKKSLSVFFHNGMTESAENQYELCFRTENVELPKEGHFGVTAATGGLADDHDVSTFITHSLRPNEDQTGGNQEVPEDDRKKFEKEFEEYYEKLQKAKDEYTKEHPEAGGNKFDYEFEGQEARELKQIFDAQESIHHILRDLNSKVDAIVGRQERTLSQLSTLSGGGTVANSGNAGSVVSKYDVDEILRSQRSVADSVQLIHSRVNELHKNQGATGGNKAQYDSTGHFNEIKNHINTLQNDVRGISNAKGPELKCPEVVTPSCVSSTMFLFIAIFQMIVFIGYSVYRSSKDAQAKKFY